MLNRQKAILSLLKEVGGQASRLEVTKWAFLIAQETALGGERSFYRFLPYYYGPYSFSLYQEVSSLIRDGWVEVANDQAWRLTPAALRTEWHMPSRIRDAVRYIVQRYGSIPAPELIDQIYRQYPWYSVNSRNKSKRLQTRPIAELGIYTIGYEGWLVDEFFNVLMKQGIHRIIDVRNNPISRRYGFHVSTLHRICSKLGIDYVSLPELGIPPRFRTGLDDPTDYSYLFEVYRDEFLPQQVKTLEELGARMQEKPSVLMCQEANPDFCHRLHLAHALTKWIDLPIIHLGWPR